MKRIAFAASIGLLFLALGSASLWAQATAQINGTVRDQSGAVLPGAEIIATQTDTGVARNAITDETGSYVLPNLPIGPYRVEAALPGFRTYIQTGIVVQVNSNPAINPTLQVGQVTEQVEVQANAAMVETRSVGIGQVIENERILDLPLNGRQVTDLITLSGAAVQIPVTGNSADRAMPGAVAMAVAGGLSTGTVYVLDGAVHNDPSNNLNLPLPFPDALQEFKVETSALSAQYGMYSGASVNAVTKSGTNELHGDLFEFVRNDLFNARNYFATTHSTLKRNQFGGTVGAAIKQNKLFFFGGYQGTTVRQDPADNKAYVPTEAMLAGDFTAISSPGCNAGRPTPLKAPFVNSRIDPALFSKAAINVVNKLPKTSDPCGLVTFGARKVTDEAQYVGRTDYQLSDKQSLFGRYLASTFVQPSPYDLDPNKNVLNTINAAFDNLAQAFAFGDTYLLGPNTVNSLRLAVNRTAIARIPVQFFSGPDVGVNMYTYTPKNIQLNITGGFQVGVPTGPNRTTTYNLSDDINLVSGTHQIAVGGNTVYFRNNFNVNASSFGAFVFNGQTTGLGLGDFLTGNVSQLTQRAPSRTYTSQWYLGSYIADAWRVTPKLTFNYGLRWEPFLPQVVRSGQIANFSEDRYKANIKSTVFNNAPVGMYYPGDSGFPGTSCRSSGVCNATAMYSKWWQMTPRVGFAWDPRGDGRTSIRASYAMAHDMLTGGFLYTFITPPWQTNVTLSNPPGGFDNPWQGYPGGNPFPGKPIDANVEFPAIASYIVVPYDNPATTRHSWNLSVQRQVAADWLASASYLGSQMAHVWGSQELNPAIYLRGGPCTIKGVSYNPCSTTTNRDVRRKLALTYPNIGGAPISFLSQYQANGTESYHGMLLSLQRRAARGLTIGGNYTWSHCYGDDSKASSGGAPGATYTDPDNRDFDRGNCEGDRRHLLNTTAVAETPRFANSTLRALAGGWRFSGIYRWLSGTWLSITSGQDRTFSGVASQRAQQVLENPYGDKSLTNYLNPSAFALPAIGSLGNMRPRNVEGPSTWQFDMAVSRIFRFRESHRLEFRAEAYNITNSLRPGNPNTNLSSNTFGQINTSADPRIMQFALKYIF
jgi:hypothetical protein